MYPDPWHKETMLSHLTHSHNLRVNQSKWNLFHLLNIYIMNQRRKRYMRVAFVCLFCSMSVDRPHPRVNFWRRLSDMGWWYIKYKMENSPQCVLVILADDIGVLHSFRNIKMVLCSDYIYIALLQHESYTQRHAPTRTFGRLILSSWRRACIPVLTLIHRLIVTYLCVNHHKNVWRRWYCTRGVLHWGDGGTSHHISVLSIR